MNELITFKLNQTMCPYGKKDEDREPVYVYSHDCRKCKHYYNGSFCQKWVKCTYPKESNIIY